MKTKKKAGRPAGAKTKAHKQVIELATACPHCSKGPLITKKKNAAVSGVFLVGEERFNTLIRRCVICKSCGIHSMKMCYENN